MRFWIARPGGKPTGPFELDKLARACEKGTLPPDTLACREDSDRWVSLHDLVSYGHGNRIGTRPASPPPVPKRADLDQPDPIRVNAYSSDDDPPSSREPAALPASKPFAVAMALKTYCWIMIFASLAFLSLSLYEFVKISQRNLTFGEQALVEHWAGWLCCILVPLWIPYIAIWCVWMYRATTLARSVASPALRVTPLWAMGCGFIPLAGPWLEALVMREVWQASTMPRNWHTQSVPRGALRIYSQCAAMSQGLMLIYFVFMAISEAPSGSLSIPGFGTTGTAQMTHSVARRLAHWDVLSQAFSVIASIALLNLVTRIDRAQQALASRLEPGAPPVTPPGI